MALIETLASESEARLEALRKALTQELKQCLPAKEQRRICVFATGSLARLEANAFSDLDAFFYIMGGRTLRPDPVYEIKTFNSVIKVTKECGFPDFSGGGEYLHFQFLREVMENIGSRSDDYINGFTSRMLLILEGTALFNSKAFSKARSAVVERYFRDFHDHSDSFRPIFILNDVLRFWRTLCINYENRREWKVGSDEQRSKGHLNNLKLRFSRLMMCYSFIAALMNASRTATSEVVLQIANKTPIQRLREISISETKLASEIEEALLEYEWFLNAMNHPKDDVLNWIAIESERKSAFARSQIFIQKMYEIVFSLSEKHGYTRFLII